MSGPEVHAGAGVGVEVIPVRGLPEVRPGDDLAAVLARLLRGTVLPGDVVAVTQKIVSKAEGRVVPEGNGRAAWVKREARRVVARRGDLVIAETRHGFVCANAGVDASNVAAGFLTLLPDDPDASAERIRDALSAGAGGPVAVVVTDTFGRPWRRGVVNVAIGCAGLSPLVDLRGTLDHTGRVLEATVVAVADEVAAASGLVMGKAARVPVAIVRGLDVAVATGGRASELVRPPDEDLFRESALQSLHSLRSSRSFGAGEVPREALEEAVRAAIAAVGPDERQSWVFLVLESEPARRRLLAAIPGADGESPLKQAPVLMVAAARPPEADRERFLVSGGAAVQNLLLALHAQGLAVGWMGPTGFTDDARAALELDGQWMPLGVVAVGWPGEEAQPAGPPAPVDLRWL